MGREPPGSSVGGATHEQTIAARLHANGQDALAIGLAGTPGYLAGSKLVTGAISEGAFVELFARARRHQPAHG